jgi:hypothetical protein
MMYRETPKRWTAEGKANRIAANRSRVISWEVRFWNQVDVRGPDECWPWTGHINDKGQSYFRKDPKPAPTVRTSRLALEIKLGRPLKKGMKALHTCDNPPCNNGAHLYEGTHQDNMDDRMRRGRTFLQRHVFEETVRDFR